MKFLKFFYHRRAGEREEEEYEGGEEGTSIAEGNERKKNTATSSTMRWNTKNDEKKKKKKVSTQLLSSRVDSLSYLQLKIQGRRRTTLVLIFHANFRIFRFAQLSSSLVKFEMQILDFEV